MAAFTSWTCGRCGTRDGFAVRFSLMWCLRICRRTCQSGAIPLDMAVQWFGLGREEIVRHVGFARAPIPPSAQSESCCGQLRRPGIYQRMEVIHVQEAVRMAFSKHAKRGGPEYIQALYDNYVLEHNIDLLSRGLSICGVEFRGLRQAFRLCWWLLDVDPSMVPYFRLVTSPYFYPRTYSIKIESSFWREGRKRDKRVVRGSNLRRGIPCDELGIHLEATFPSHFRTCLTARQIKQGVFLTVSEEDDMTRALCLKREDYWPKGHSTPQKVIHFCGRL
jgi:hypothetical protein